MIREIVWSDRCRSALITKIKCDEQSKPAKKRELLDVGGEASIIAGTDLNKKAGKRVGRESTLMNECQSRRSRKRMERSANFASRSTYSSAETARALARFFQPQHPRDSCNAPEIPVAVLPHKPSGL